MHTFVQAEKDKVKMLGTQKKNSNIFGCLGNIGKQHKRMIIYCNSEFHYITLKIIWIILASQITLKHWLNEEEEIKQTELKIEIIIIPEWTVEILYGYICWEVWCPEIKNFCNKVK